MSARHIAETDLALYVSGDLAMWRRAVVRLHVGRCGRCRGHVDAYRADREDLRQIASEIPDGLAWDRLAAEMTANIRVGLAAGECVAPRRRARTVAMSWRPAAAMAGLAGLLMGAWWLNMPPGETQSLGRAMRAIVTGRGGAVPEERGQMVEASSSGVELHENGSTLGVSQGEALPVAVSVSMQVSASARYVNDKTGQMTITSVYVQ